MTNREDHLKRDEAIESILRSAPPRPVPSAADVATARSAVREEWLTLCGRRRMRRRLVSLAAAASIVGAIAAGLLMLRVPSALPEQVAAIDRATGPVYLLDDQAMLHELDDMPGLSTGQTLVTGDGAAALTWLGGGSLRIDRNSRIEFVSPGEIFLHGGRVYFDSQPSALQARAAPPRAAAFVVRSVEGLVHHVGTQYMAGISPDGLTVSVREGQVKVVGNTVDATAAAGQQVRLRDNARPSYTNISTYGDAWRWAEQIGPEVIVDQRSAHEFIGWVARETGLDVRFEDETVEQLAHATRMSGGSGSLEPRTALAVLLQTTTLEATIEDGSIYISER